MNNTNGSAIVKAGLEGQRVVLAGAGFGVGPAVAAALHDAGASLVVDADVQGRAPIVANRGDVDQFVAECVSALGGIDVLIIAAPPVKNKHVFEMTAEELRAVTEDELVQPALLMLAAAKHMSQKGYGRIIVLASMSAKTGAHHNVAPYAAAKGGLLAYVRALASETAEHGVTVNGIATSLFEPQVATMTEEKRANLKKGIPVGRFGRSEEAAHAVVFLASPLAGFVTGECLNLSGGRFMD